MNDDVAAKIARRRAELADPVAAKIAARRAELGKPSSGKAFPELSAAFQDAIRKPTDSEVLDNSGRAFGAAAKFVQGVPFVGQYVDELAGALDPLFGSTGGADQVRRVQGAMDREYPKTSTALQVAGGIAGSIPLVAAAAPYVASAAPVSMAGKVIAGATGGAATGAVEGAVSGYGAGNDGNRMAAAKSGAGFGGAFGAVAGAAAPMVSAGVQALAQRFKGVDFRAIAKTLGISPGAAKVLKADLEALDFDAAKRNLSTAGPDAMLADAGLPTREALDTAITGGGKAARIGTDAVSARAAASGRKLEQTMDAVLGAPQGTKAAARGIAARTAPARKAAYDSAYASPIDYAGKGRDIEAVLERIPSNTLKSAVDEANAAMKAAGVKNMQIMAEIAEDGSVTFKEMPNVQQLDEIKKALGSVAAENVDQFGRPTAAGIRAKRLARELRDAIADSVPVYKRAVSLGGDKIAEDQALDMGRKMFGPSITREDVSDLMSDASIEAKTAMRQGIREYIDGALARVRRNIDDPSLDITETRRLLDTLSTRDARTKVESVLGKGKAAALFREIDAVGKQFATRQSIATGSQTARRTARNATIDEVVAPGVVGNMAKGEIPASARSMVQFLTRQTPANQSAQKQAVLADVAKALTSMRGAEAQKALAAVEKAIQGQPMKTEDAALIGRLVGASVSIGGYQTGTRSLPTPQGAR